MDGLHAVPLFPRWAQTLKNRPAVWGWPPSLGWKEPLGKGVATHSSFLAWRIPWTEEPDGAYRPWGHRDTTEQLS